MTEPITKKPRHLDLVIRILWDAVAPMTDDEIVVTLDAAHPVSAA